MYRLRIESCLLLGAALLAACSERNGPTAPSARLLAATAALPVDRPYAWSLKCSGDLYSWANWSWTTAGQTIAGTEVSVSCSPSSSVSGTGTRPATADGFSACVNGTCQVWAVDPATSFKTQLKGTDSYIDPLCGFVVRGHRGACKITWTATLIVDS